MELNGSVAWSLGKYYENIWFVTFMEELEVELEKEMVETWREESLK